MSSIVEKISQITEREAETAEMHDTETKHMENTS